VKALGRALWFGFRVVNACAFGWIAATCALFCAAFGIVAAFTALGAWGAWPLPREKSTRAGAPTSAAGMGLADPSAGARGNKQPEAPAPSPVAVVKVRNLETGRYALPLDGNPRWN
jgi:hypothetical protein